MRSAAAQILPSQVPSLEDLVAFVPTFMDMTPKLQENYDGAICDRWVPEAVRAWLQSMSSTSLPEGRFVLEPHLVGACVERVFLASGIPACPSLNWLSEDVQALANEISALAPSTRLRLSIEAVYDNACSKMHVDNVVARLICAYRGPGTVLGRDGSPDEQTLSVPTGAPILLKGKQWIMGQTPTLRHRSPRIEGTQQDRMVLVLEGCPDDAILPTHDTIFEGGAVTP